MRTFTVSTAVFTLGYIYGFALPMLAFYPALLVAGCVICGCALAYSAFYLDKHKNTP